MKETEAYLGEKLKMLLLQFQRILMIQRQATKDVGVIAD